jgi:Tol biopolymer transport system component
MTAGQTLNHFEILEALGDGEFGPTYKARDAVTGREVELEVLPAGGALDIDRLRQEVKSASALEHWNIPRLYELARAGDVIFLVREHVTGRTLKQALPLPPAEALDCARQIAGALAAAHGIGVTHRHLNPRNVVLGEQNAPKLVNFGLTPARRDPAYVAPEQLDGRGADARADIFSFGKLLEEMCGPAASKPLSGVIARATRKDAARRFQLMAEVQAALEKIVDPAAHGHERNHRLLLIMSGAVVAIGVLGWWMLGGRKAVNPVAARVTSDTGLTTESAISSDGRTIAYASDRGSPGILHLWVQPLSGGSATRLTSGTEDDHQPEFAPDTSRIVFRSEQDGGALYSIASAGGAPQLLVKDGRDPHYSPDGRWICYWSGDPLSPGGAAIWVIASHGGAPVRIHDEFSDARYPIWSPDGKHLLFVGHSDAQRGKRGGSGDWYVAPFENGSSRGRATRTGAETLLHMQAFRETSDGYYSGAFVIPEVWVPGQVLFSGRLERMGRNPNRLPHLLRIPVSDSILQTTGAAHEITPAAEWDAHPSMAANGRLVFSRRTNKAGIWTAPADGSGEPHPATPDEGEVRFSVSADGKRLAYRFQTDDRHQQFRIVDLDTGQQAATLAQPNASGNWAPVISPDGDQLVYTGPQGTFRVGLSGAPERISRRGRDRILSWSADGKRILVQRGCCGIAFLNPESGDEREILADEVVLSEARLSPDGKWVAFTRLARPTAQIFVAALEAPEQRMEVTPEDVRSGSPAWAPDGRQIYFLTQCHGFRCIWARRLDARKGVLQGAAFPVRHFHHVRYQLLGAIDPQNVGLAVTRGQLVFGMFETTGNIWSLPALPRP